MFTPTYSSILSIVCTLLRTTVLLCLPDCHSSQVHARLNVVLGFQQTFIMDKLSLVMNSMFITKVRVITPFNTLQYPLKMPSGQRNETQH